MYSAVEIGHCPIFELAYNKKMPIKYHQHAADRAMPYLYLIFITLNSWWYEAIISKLIRNLGQVGCYNRLSCLASIRNVSCNNCHDLLNFFILMNTIAQGKNNRFYASPRNLRIFSRASLRRIDRGYLASKSLKA